MTAQTTPTNRTQLLLRLRELRVAAPRSLKEEQQLKQDIKTYHEALIKSLR